MKRQIKVLAIVFSVTLNLVFMGFGVYEWVGQRRAGTHAHRKLPHPYLWKRLNLRPDQVKQFTSVCRPFRRKLHEEGRRIREKQLQLLDILAKRPSDRAAIDATMRDIEELQHRMQASVIEHLLRETKILTHEQRLRFYALLKERMRASRLQQPGWMPRTEHSGHSQH